MFFEFNQNNSGGKLVQDDRVGDYVIIEADGAEEANDKAEKIGIYFNGCSDGLDCSCCGDRWHPIWNYSSGTKEPTICRMTIEEFKNELSYSSEEEIFIHIYYKNGDHKLDRFNANELIKKNAKNKRDKADKLWANRFSKTYGVAWETPRRVYQSEYDKNIYYDKDGNNGFELEAENYDNLIIKFTSKNKNEVIEFFDGVNDAYKSMINAVNNFPEGEGKKAEGIRALKKLYEV